MDVQHWASESRPSGPREGQTQGDVASAWAPPWMARLGSVKGREVPEVGGHRGPWTCRGSPALGRARTGSASLPLRTTPARSPWLPGGSARPRGPSSPRERALQAQGQRGIHSATHKAEGKRLKSGGLTRGTTCYRLSGRWWRELTERGGAGRARGAASGCLPGRVVSTHTRDTRLVL